MFKIKFELVSEKFISGASLADWRLALGHNNSSLAEELHESTDPYADVRQLGLPTPTYRFFDKITEFLSTPDEDISSMEAHGYDEFYVSLRPNSTRLPKYREIVYGNQIVPYVRKSVSQEQHGNYNIRIAGHHPEICGGSIIIDFDGGIKLEMVNGNQAKLSRGSVAPHFTGQTNLIGNMRYNFEDATIREYAWRAISAIPFADTANDTESFRRSRHPGYYEFAITQRPSGTTGLLFYDYRKLAQNSPFLISPK